MTAVCGWIPTRVCVCVDTTGSCARYDWKPSRPEVDADEPAITDAPPRRVFVVIEDPDMTYYGDARVHGVYSTREAAEAKATEADRPQVWTGGDWERIRVVEIEIDDNRTTRPHRARRQP